METWDNNNLPEAHKLFSNITFVAITEDTWRRKKQDGTEEIAPKWDLISSADENGNSLKVQIYSSTDKEEIKLNQPYDIIVKGNYSKDGSTFYGYSLKGFGSVGQPIPKKEPQSRWQKGQKLNAKAEALKAAATLCMGTDNADKCIAVAEIFESWLNGTYESPTKGAAKAFGDETKKGIKK